MPSISRRKVLGGLAVGGGAWYAFSDPVDRAIFGRIRDCPSPDGHELPCRIRRLEDSAFDVDDGFATITSRSGLPSSVSELGRSTRAFIDDVDFGSGFLLAIRVSEPSDAKGVHFVGVEKGPARSVYSYSCVTHPDVWGFLPDPEPLALLPVEYTWLVHVQAAFEPTFARHYHKGGNGSEVFVERSDAD